MDAHIIFRDGTGNFGSSLGNYFFSFPGRFLFSFGLCGFVLAIGSAKGKVFQNMTNFLFILCGLGLLRGLKSESPSSPSSFKKQTAFFLNESREIIFHVFVILFVYVLVARQADPAIENEIAIPFFVIVTFVASRASQKSNLFFVLVTGLCLALLPSSSRDLSILLHAAALLMAGFVLFGFLWTSLRHRLLFSQIPKPFRGLPILFWTAAILAMAFGALAQITDILQVNEGQLSGS